MPEVEKKYDGVFKDDSRATKIAILNDFDTLSVEIDGVHFQGDEFDCLEIIDKSNYSTEQLQRFTFIDDVICNYQMTVSVPQIILDNQNDSHVVTNLMCEWSKGKPTPNNRQLESQKLKLSVTVGKELFEGTSNYYFDDALNEIIKQFEGRYIFKNCYGCLFSDYSPYGQQGFGGMYCFVRQKEKYLNLKIPPNSYKYDYMSELNDEYDIQQEIYSCDNYEPRKPGIGYR